MTTKPDDQSKSSDSVAPMTTEPNQAVEQSLGSPNLPKVTVLERSKPGVRATTLGGAIDFALESDPRRYNVAQFLRIVGIWANDLTSRMEDMMASIKGLREDNARLTDQLTIKREEIAALRGTEEARA